MVRAFDIDFYKIVNQYAKVTIAQYIDPELTAEEALKQGFFNPVADQLAKGSVIFVLTTTGTLILYVESSQDGDVVLSKYAGEGVITRTGKATLLSSIAANDDGGVIICNIEGDTFGRLASSQAAWTITPGATGLVIDKIIISDPNTARMLFTGVAAPGTMTIAPKTTALVNSANITAGTFVIE